MVALVQTTDLPPISPSEPDRVAANPRQPPRDWILALSLGPPPRGPFRRNFRNFRRVSWTRSGSKMDRSCVGCAIGFKNRHKESVCPEHVLVEKHAPPTGQAGKEGLG